MFLHGVEDAQDVQEQVDDIQVEIDGCQDVLLWGQLVHQQMGIENNEAAEQQSSGPSKHQLHSVIVEEELHRQLHSLWNVAWIWNLWVESMMGYMFNTN